ncbi:MAG: hypothetical protein E7812_01980 [Phenylobacterium sp.]|nr:MAG: hypothetical protein E7812_01980 [Phenylobacterium sp.]
MPPRPRPNPALKLMLIRQVHVYVSAFVAPSLLFFAASGALQTFRLPDQAGAPAVLVKLARVHKDDVFAGKPPRPEPAAGARAHRAGPRPEKPKPSPATTALKWFFAMASVGMIATTFFGLWMGLAYSRRKAPVWALLAAGAAAPVVLLMAAG